MCLPMAEQEDLYANYWRKIEETFGADSYDQVFDDFLRNWLTVISARRHRAFCLTNSLDFHGEGRITPLG